MRHFLVLVAFSALATAALAPPTAAQASPELLGTGLLVRLEPLESPLPPLGAAHSARGTVTYHYPTAGAVPGSSVQVDLTLAEFPAWANVVLDPSTLVLTLHPQSGTTSEASAEFTLRAAASDAAPAFHAETVRVVAEAAPTGLLAGATAEDATVLVAGYRSIIDVDAGATAFRLPPSGSVDVPITVANLGNGPTTVRVTVIDAPPHVTVYPPTGVSLDAKASGGTRNEDVVIVGVDADRRFEGGDLILRFEGRYALDPKLRGDVEVLRLRLDPERGSTGLVEAQAAGVTHGPSGLPLALALAGAAAGALVGARRARRA